MGIGNRLIANVAFATAFVLGTALVSTGARAATVLYNNLSAPTSGYADSINNFGPLYDSFSTGASGSTLFSLSLLIGGNNDSGTINVGLYGDIGTQTQPQFAGSPISDFTESYSSLPPSPTVVTFYFAPVPLAANTRYWIVLSDDSNSSVVWYWSGDTSGFGVKSEFYANTNGIFPNSDTGPYQMEVTATPLPASWIMMLTGLAGFGFLTACRRRANGAASPVAA